VLNFGQLENLIEQYERLLDRLITLNQP